MLSSAATNFLMDTTLGTCNINPLRCKIKIPNCFYFILLLSYNFLNYFVIIYRVSFYPLKNHNAFIYVTKYTRYNKNQYKLQNCLSSARETSEIAVCRQIHHFQNIHACRLPKKEHPCMFISFEQTEQLQQKTTFSDKYIAPP